jgi:hypothetical protein
MFGGRDHSLWICGGKKALEQAADCREVMPCMVWRSLPATGLAAEVLVCLPGVSSLAFNNVLGQQLRLEEQRGHEETIMGSAAAD